MFLKLVFVCIIKAIGSVFVCLFVLVDCFKHSLLALISRYEVFAQRADM